MNVFIHRLATYVPSNTAPQNELAIKFGEWAGDASTARVIHHLFRKTGIERRYSVVPDFTEPDRAELFQVDAKGRLISASTQERNRVYGRFASPISVQLGRDVLQGSQFDRRTSPMSLLSPAQASSIPDRIGPSSRSSDWLPPWSVIISGSWAVTQRCPPCAWRVSSASRVRTRSC
jgi:hypothetical protein